MTTTERNIEVLNDLIRINNDRVDGYNRAIEELKDEDHDLRLVFQACTMTSKKLLTQLIENVNNLGGEPAKDNTAAGKVYHVWMDVKTTFSGHDAVSILNACEFGEDAAQKAYKLALDSRSELSSDIVELITAQKSQLKLEHDEIRDFRDSMKAVK